MTNLGKQPAKSLPPDLAVGRPRYSFPKGSCSRLLTPTRSRDNAERIVHASESIERNHKNDGSQFNIEQQWRGAYFGRGEAN